jgi:hypothetical protein
VQDVSSGARHPRALQQLLGLVAAGKFLGGAQRGQRLCNASGWGLAGGLVKDVRADLLNDIVDILVHQLAQLLAQCRQVGIHGLLGFY